MAKLHHELGFIKFIITSEVIVKVSLTEPTLAQTVITKAGLKSVKVINKGLHHFVLDQLSAWSLYSGRVSLPKTRKLVKRFSQTERFSSAWFHRLSKAIFISEWAFANH